MELNDSKTKSDGARIDRGKLIASLLTCLMLTVSRGTIRAGEFEDGVAAYQRRDFATALGFFQPLADQGNADARTNLGVMYEKGQGIARDYRKAVRLYRLAARQGRPDAQFNLGVMCYEGHGVAQGYRGAVRWFWLAAEQGNAAAQSNLGFMYEKKGQGIAENLLRAHMWYSLAASRLIGDDRTLATEYRDSIEKRLSTAQVVRRGKWHGNAKRAA
jgi:tetratricopeptide (TPR) repeat protein